MIYADARRARKALFAQRLKLARQRKDLSQSQLAVQLGTGITRSGVAKWEIDTESAEPEYETLVQLADFLGVTVNYLLGLTERMEPDRQIANLIPAETMRQVPVMGTIAAGHPVLAVEEGDETIALPADVLPAGDVFALRVRGDSMIEEQIYDGDLAVIEQMPIVPDKTIAAVLVEDEATLKTVRFFDDHVVLMPANPAYRPMMYRPDEVRILGKLRMVVQHR